MIKSLAYCAFLRRADVSLPEAGVSGAPLQELAHNELRLLWSDVEWPFADASLQRSAVEFHQVITQVFSQTAVVPFRLLSLFDGRQSLADFAEAHHRMFVADLERLQNVVQMECVLYPAPEPVTNTSGRNYLEQKAAALRQAEGFIQEMKTALGSLAKETRTRESKKATRIFVLVERGNEERFHSMVRGLPLPERLARRTSGPWPPAEFLSDSVKMPELTRL